MRKIVLLAAAALLSACGFGPDYPQFSQASYRIEGMTTPAGGGAPAHTVIYRDGAKMRVETVLAGYGHATVVFDDATNAAYVLDPATLPTTTAQPEASAPAQVPAVNPPSTGIPTTGVAVRIDNVDAPQPLETSWAALGAENARSTGRCEVAGEAGHEWTPRRPPAQNIERAACITEDGIVLRVVEGGRTLWEATSLQRGAQDPTLFGVPPGYQMIDPRALAAQVGDQIDSVTGAPPEPREAPAPRG